LVEKVLALNPSESSEPEIEMGQASASHVMPAWVWLSPCAAWLVLLGAAWFKAPWFALLESAALAAAVMASVHHAEVIAHRVGEPFGTLVLALAVTAIEVALILSLMLGGGESTAGLARDTVFAAVMIILNGMVGVCLLLGGHRHHEQEFQLRGVSAGLVTLAAITGLTLILPNLTSSVPGPFYSSSQLVFIGVVSLVLYLTFVFVQTVRHRDYFLPANAKQDMATHQAPPSNRATALSAVLLLACLGAVVLLAKAIAPHAENLVVAWGAPKSVVGVLIATVILLPEGVAAVRAARANRLQTSLNLALGSALASIGLTIPAVAALSLMIPMQLALGIDMKSAFLLLLSLMVASFSLGTGRTTVLQGVVHLVLFAVFLFVSIVP
jgi:Ca2+:H+ antiporter